MPFSLTSTFVGMSLAPFQVDRIVKTFYCRVKSRKPDQLVNLITLRFLDFGVPTGIKGNVIDQVYGTRPGNLITKFL